MWLKLLPFMASVVFICKASCVINLKYFANTTTYTDDFDPDDYYVEKMHKLYDYRLILLRINCRINSNPFFRKVRSMRTMILVCTNSTYEGYGISYYKDTVLDYYNINTNVETLTVFYGSESIPSYFQYKKYAVLGRIVYARGCDGLQDISVKNSNLEENSQWKEFLNYFTDVTNLTKLDIQDTPLSKYKITEILSRVIIKEFTLRNCSLNDLPYNFLDLARGLTRLDLSHNQLRFVTFVPELKKSTVFENLEFMDLSYNDLRHGASVMYTAALMPRLRDLILDHNSHLDICKSDYSIHQFRKQKDQQWMVFSNLSMISASFTGTSRLCFDFMKMEKLFLFNISFSMVSTLSLQELPTYHAPNFTMDLRGTDIIHTNYIGANEYEAMKSRFIERNNSKATVLINVKQLQCDCQYWWLQKALKDISNLKVQDISCSNGIQLIHQERNSLNCTKFNCGNCVCRRYAKSTTANCSFALTHTLPTVQDLSHIYAASNYIKSFNTSFFTEMLIYVDISFNRISRLDLKTLRAMFSKEDRHFRLAGNQMICDCTNQELLRIFRLHRLQVDDYEELTCAGDKTLLYDVKEDRLCDSKQSITETQTLTIALTTICAVLVILGLINFLYYRYRHQIKIFLYARGCLLCCIRENDVDENRPYDVFISFAHEDEEFITDSLLPRLETGATIYRTCVHLRDWIPGEMIPTQIMKSIDGSRRTVIVVSKNYVKSLWGLMEFHMAHASAMTEKRMRVIVILLENMCEDDILDPELRLYMQTNTYLQWGDPWFWDKLRYALPHKPDA